MIQNDTIIALATPAGVGAISIIRLSGEKSIEIVAAFFSPVKKGKLLAQQKSHTLHLGHIVRDNVIIDQVLVSIFKNPNSYTGENVVEISCHGSSFIQQEILQLFLSNGCRMADNGEFTMRAFLNGKMDLSQAEAVADVIASNSAASHQVAIQQMRGGITNELQELRAQLLDFAALIELELDFSGEDVEFADRTKFKQLVATISSVLKRLIDSFAFGNAMKNGIPVAIIGEPNVGKSTLLNALLNEEKAIVSDIAGTTRDAIEDEVIMEGVAFRFIDTAGIRKTKDVVENIGIKKAYEKAENAQLIIFLINAEKFAQDPEAFLSEINVISNRFPHKRVLTIANKIDKISKEKLAELTSKVSDLILLSAKQKIGIDALKEELMALVNTGALSNNETIVTNSRHFEALTQALESIESVKNGIALDISSDLFAIDIRECLRHLGNITGEYDVDKDILGHIFGNFCIGK
ncbi:tRNA uridine-5-carboxymethylaminomethyl(34) synthesis GTPase MnmE [Tenacibaculum sp. SG-28]|uniref:tRNA uridine-5-carboxymethylaminomethyl(34) synthesis GTPase MnmE n=1 Tax=Tenacibaculum sp. SG-28 TaxID=754426 RepID=UPI000CF4ADDD|nr:tRNA uridine-5-carboxymethylaminomethyl(34) synthesis GTPase MnmE [Tenacibaculum sp. SG-28]PQJ23447.1 tRNA uridine-5-carboxymethylaminomethyl(34) synthesis GTPase MnmE [Tenacibaculum sp. SG-28]